MNDTSHTPDEEKLAALLLRWEEGWEHGEDVSAVRLCEDCPELVEPLQRQIDILKRMAWMNDDPMVASSHDDSDSVPSTDPLISKMLADRYRVETQIAEGGFGRVYRAFDTELERLVAVKVPKRNRTASPDQADNLLTEARKAAKLRHPGIVSVHDVGQDEGEYFIVTDLIEGESLAQVIERRRLDPLDAARLIAEIAAALHFAHQSGFIHRDIKPQNILIDEDSNPLVTDFGIALSGEDRLEVSSSSGTLPYMAPEQLVGNVSIDRRVDIYALGVVLYQLLTGQLPFDDSNPSLLIDKIRNEPPPSIQSLNPKVSNELEQICLRCLAKDPAERFRDASDLRCALRKTAAPPSIRGKWILTALALLVFGVILLLLRTSGNSSPSGQTVSPEGKSTVPEAEAVTSPLGDLITDAESTDKEEWKVDEQRQRGASASLYEDMLYFDGASSIYTGLDRTMPSTFEAWMRPTHFENEADDFIYGKAPFRSVVGLLCGTALSAEDLVVLSESTQRVSPNQWSHVAAVFGDDETRFYLNGKLVATGPAPEHLSGPYFTIGRVGNGDPMRFVRPECFSGAIRCLRISKGERYTEEFTPDEKLKLNATDAPNPAILIYDGSANEDERVIDLSGNGHDGEWEWL